MTRSLSRYSRKTPSSPTDASSKPSASARTTWAAHSSAVRKSWIRKIVGSRSTSRFTGHLQSAEHDVGPLHVLAAAQHGGALVDLPVDEHQRHAAHRPHGQQDVAGPGEEVRLAAGEVVVEVDHERHLTAFVLVAHETAVGVRGEAFPWVVAVVAPALVEAEQLPAPGDDRRQVRPGALEHTGGLVGVVDHGAGVVADALVHDGAGDRGDRRLLEARRLGAGDGGVAFLGREEVVEDE